MIQGYQTKLLYLLNLRARWPICGPRAHGTALFSGQDISLFITFCLLVVKDSCEQSEVNTIESLQGFHPL